MSPSAPPALARPLARPLEGQIITIFGGGGFVGRAAAEQLLQAGARLRIAQRHPARAHNLRALGNLGQVQLVGADVRNANQVLRAAWGSDILINLAGSFADMARIMGDGAGHVAAAAAHVGARLIHISAIGADAASASAYGRAKAAGEAAVRAAMPDATILRPSLIFGAEDALTNRFATLLRALPAVPVFGPETRVQPVFVGDVGAAIAAVATGAPAGDFELGGADILTMHALWQWIGEQIGHNPSLIDLPNALSALIAKATGWLPGAPITADQWAMLAKDNLVAPGARTLGDLGISPTPIASAAPTWLARYRRQGRFTAIAAREA